VVEGSNRDDEVETVFPEREREEVSEEVVDLRGGSCCRASSMLFASMSIAAT
jgi:hypothetical protein